MKKEHCEDLRFTFIETKTGEIIIHHFGRKAITLRSDRAIKFLQDSNVSTIKDQQQLMARLTGNYKRGNEKFAKKHPRNKG